MNREECLKKISELQSVNDQLMAELRYLNNLLKEIGFEEGITTLKTTLQEMLDQESGQ